MNIFIITPRLCYGGAERVSVLLGNGLSQNGHEVSFITNLSNPITYALNKNIKTIDISYPNNNKIKKWFHAIKVTRKTLKRQKVDVIIGIMSTCSLIAKIASIGLNIPIIATEHDAFERPASAPFSLYYWFTKFIFNRLYPYLTVLTTPDKNIAQKTLKNTYVMPNPLSFTPQKTIPSKKKIILAVGRLEDWHYKGFDILIKAWVKIAFKYPDWNLHIVGEGDSKQKEFLLNIAREGHVYQQTHLIDFNPHLNELFEEASIFVLSSRYEGFGLVLIEAMSQGCACIAADYNGRQKEIFGNSKVGITIEPENIREMSKALEELITNEHKRKDFALNSITRSKEYELDKIIQKWEILLSLTQQEKKHK